MAVKEEGIEVLTGPTEKFPCILDLGHGLVNFEEVLVARYAAAVLWRAGPLSILHKVGSVGFVLVSTFLTPRRWFQLSPKS
jgi:hypothetical protein